VQDTNTPPKIESGAAEAFATLDKIARLGACASEDAPGGRRRRVSGVSQFQRGADAAGELAALAGEGAEFAVYLEPVPKPVRLTEEGSEADGHGGGDGAFTEDDLVDGAGRHAERAGHGVLRDTHGLEILFEQDLSRGDRWFHAANVVIEIMADGMIAMQVRKTIGRYAERIAVI
jgi:hypothetical protein